MSAGRKALVVATYTYADDGLRQLTAPEHDAEAFATVLEDPEIAGFDVTTLVNQPHYVVGEAIADFYADCRRDDLTLLYFSGHGVKDDEGRLHLAMTNTRREALLFTAISAAQLNEAMDASPSRRKVLILDCCYSGAFPAGRSAKSDEGVHTLERFQGKGRAVLTASDATQYAFEGDDLSGSGASSVFTRYLVEAIRSGAADLDEDGDIALDELYSYVRDRVVAEVPQQRPKKQEDVDGRILIARNVHWTLPAHLRYAVESPIAAQRLSAVDGLVHLHRVGNDVVRAAVDECLASLAHDDSRSVSTAATEAQEQLRLGGPASPVHPAESPPPAAALAEERPPAPVPVAEAPAPRPAPRAPSRGRSGPPVLLAALVAAGGLLVASRFMVFESRYGYHAVSLGWSTPTWVVQVLLPVVLAVGVLLAGRSLPWGAALAGGVAAGVLLSLVSQLVTSLIVTLDPDVGYGLGPAWWLILAAAVLLAVGVVVVSPSFGARPSLRRNRRSAVSALLVVVSAVAWTVTGAPSVDFGWWLYIQFAGLLFCAACLPVAVLDLNVGQAVFGLAAVTTTGAWLVSVAVETLLVRPSGYQPAALFSGLAATLLAVGGAWLGRRT
ncbi:MAG: caspase family protein [Blastococcus sp.]